MANGITVKLAIMATPLKIKRMKKPMTIVEFLEKNDLDYNSKVTVNGKKVSRDYVLKENDIVFVVTGVDGGNV